MRIRHPEQRRRHRSRLASAEQITDDVVALDRTLPLNVPEHRSLER
jgi:hypothetical protein